MIVKLTKHGRGNVKKAIDYVLREKNAKGDKRELVEVIYGNPDEIIVLSNTSSFKEKVKKLKYFSGVIALSPGERLTPSQMQYLIEEFGKTLNNSQTDIPFVVVKHLENDKEHYHFLGLRFDLITRSFCNPFRPGWQRKWVAWAKLMEHELGLAKVEEKKDSIEREYYRVQLLLERNPRLQNLEVKAKALELAYLCKNFGLEVEDERIKRILSKADRPTPRFCNTTDPEEIRKIVRSEIERDRRHNEEYKPRQAATDSEYIIEFCDHYPIFVNSEEYSTLKRRKVTMEQVQNSKEELERFKREISLIDFWVANGGQVLERSTRNSYRIRWNGEKFLVSKNENGHWLFQGIDDETKRGSIVDLCNLMGMQNLGQIRKYLRQLIAPVRGDEEKTERNTESEKVKQSTCVEPAAGGFEELRRLSWDTLVRMEIWKERCIDPLQLKEFLQEVYTDKHGNLCFPIINSQGEVIGYEVKGRNGFKLNYKSKQGLAFIGVNSILNEAIVITESVFDALAYEALRQRPKRFHDCLYLSTSGQLTNNQVQQIKDLIRHKKAVGRLNRVVLAFDNDAQGRKYAQKLKEHLKNLEVEVTEHYSFQKDWNDELKAKARKEEAIWQELQERERQQEQEWKRVPKGN